MDVNSEERFWWWWWWMDSDDRKLLGWLQKWRRGCVDFQLRDTCLLETINQPICILWCNNTSIFTHLHIQVHVPYVHVCRLDIRITVSSLREMINQSSVLVSLAPRMSVEDNWAYWECIGSAKIPVTQIHGLRLHEPIGFLHVCLKTYRYFCIYLCTGGWL